MTSRRHGNLSLVTTFGVFLLRHGHLSLVTIFGVFLLKFPSSVVHTGYSVTSLRHGSTEYFVAGAPRANHTGLVVVYTVDSTGQASIRDTQRGTQVTPSVPQCPS